MDKHFWWLLRVRIEAPLRAIEWRLQELWWKIEGELPSQCFLCRKWAQTKKMEYETTLSYGHYKPICPACHKQHFESLP